MQKSLFCPIAWQILVYPLRLTLGYVTYWVNFWGLFPFYNITRAKEPAVERQNGNYSKLLIAYIESHQVLHRLLILERKKGRTAFTTPGGGGNLVLEK